jgi:Polyketide cyclase / dehydrase and lipid transport
LPRRHFEFHIDCPISADRVFDAMTDFSEKRTEYFPNLSKSHYQVVERRGDTAVVVEGTGPFSSREKYDWSTKGRIWSVIEESNVAAPGGITDVRIAERGSGCRVSVALDRDFIGWRGGVIVAGIYMNGGKRFFRRTYLRMLKNVQRDRRHARKRP